jgi:hypothetical protein
MHRTRKQLMRTTLLAALLTLGSSQMIAYACAPSAYAYCAGQREACIIDGNDEEVCDQRYLLCLSQRGCDSQIAGR